jgi:hypothetical protein
MSDESALWLSAEPRASPADDPSLFVTLMAIVLRPGTSSLATSCDCMIRQVVAFARTAAVDEQFVAVVGGNL